MSAVAVAVVVVTFVSMASVLAAHDAYDAYYVRRQRARARAEALVAESDEDEGFFTHAQVLADLPNDVLEGLGHYRTKNGSVRPVSQRQPPPPPRDGGYLVVPEAVAWTSGTTQVIPFIVRTSQPQHVNWLPLLGAASGMRERA